MNRLASAQQTELRRMFGEWISFDPEERRIYSHDVGVVPKLIKPLLAGAIADAVVQPEDEAQLVALVRWANANHVHLVPRAKGTSGYGGVMPIRGGVSVSVTRMHKVLDVDPGEKTVRVQPGVVWNDLEAALTPKHLSLRNYPSSAPSSTVGGWLAQGGVGYGSYEYGRFRDNVLSARVVQPDGEVRTFEGDELDLVSEAEGITGFITEVIIKVREHEPQEVRAYALETPEALAGALKAIHGRGLPLWSVSFINPTMARLKGRLPPRLEHGHPVPARHPPLPEDRYLLLMAAPVSRWPVIDRGLREVLLAHGATALSHDLAEREWQDRFALMHIKRLGPSLLPAEAVVPLDSLDSVLDEVNRAIRQPLTLEGMVQSGEGREPQVTLLGFIPHDERTLRYGVAYSLSLTLVRIAKRYGGRSYATGLYFTAEAESVLGVERAVRLKKFKRRVDPGHVMNPGKVVEGNLIGRLIGAMLPLEPLARIPANWFGSPVGERIAGQGRRGIPDDVAWYAYACAQCGYCVDDCAQYYGRGWESESPRGKWFFLRDYMEGRAELTQEWVNNFLACTTCEMCNVKCPLELPIEPSWQKMRGELVLEREHMTFPPFDIMRASVEKDCNIWGTERKRRADWVPEELKDRIGEKSEIAYFAGCTASLVETDVAKATVTLLDKAGVNFTYLGEDESCCGIPIMCSGHWDTFEQILRHNVEAMHARGVKKVVTSCPACWLSWKHYYPQWAEKLGIPFDIETYHYSELLAEQVDKGELKFEHEVARKVTWHDSCHIGRAGGVFEPPRKLLQAIPGIELKEMACNRENAHCCGSVLSLLDDPDGAAVNIGSRRWQEALDTGADTLAALCPCCEVQFRVTAKKSGKGLPVVDLAHLAAEGLGVKLPDPTDYALDQWATFDAMIKLLKPEAMAAFMAGMLPQMMEAMPAPWRGMMHGLQGAPAAIQASLLRLMRPLLPRLLQHLLPGMLPRLMPDMLRALERVIPMSDELKRQMPDLLPGVMAGLLPRMMPLVMPYLLPKFEECVTRHRCQELARAA